MRVLLINVVCGIRSTGRICMDIAKEYEVQGHEVKIAYGRETVPEQYQKYAVRIGNDMEVKLHALSSRLFDTCGFGSKKATDDFLKWADEYNPDLLWLHNIHGYYINVEKLFCWIKSRPDMQVKWTLHDCWAFTGHCGYFTLADCDKWKTHCKHCPNKKEYPRSEFLDRSCVNYYRKKKAFTGVKNMMLVTPSQWLADLTRESFLKNYPVSVVYNTIDEMVFKPTYGDFKKKYEIEDKIMILGVASVWEKRKGLDDLLKLSTMLDNHFAVVIVGMDDKQIGSVCQATNDLFKPAVYDDNVTVFDRKNGFTDEGTVLRIVQVEGNGVAVKPGTENILKVLTGGETKTANGAAKIICIKRTNDTRELAELYTAADWFVNPTYEDNYPTVNLEAIACGTRVITYDAGGSAETLRG